MRGSAPSCGTMDFWVHRIWQIWPSCPVESLAESMTCYSPSVSLTFLLWRGKKLYSGLSRAYRTSYSWDLWIMIRPSRTSCLGMSVPGNSLSHSCFLRLFWVNTGMRWGVSSSPWIILRMYLFSEKRTGKGNSHDDIFLMWKSSGRFSESNGDNISHFRTFITIYLQPCRFSVSVKRSFQRYTCAFVLGRRERRKREFAYYEQNLLNTVWNKAFCKW